ncbi:MAG: cytochrome C biogenesis protein CcdA [Alphaproteobacteria bacterium HGW-Alphaproteobacteria-4]|nr:MAG: cytochrome C biogenesis protein CcdA [Alphaproteobacteria bacterium HGW-Alphaproteobacteria-4]
MEFLLAYGAGLLTLINPCVLPVLPIVLATSLGRHPLGPVALAAGMSVSFTAFGLGITAFGQAIGLGPERLAQAGAVAMLAFGLVLLVPRLSTGFQTATAGMATRADAGIDQTQGLGLPGQALGGALLGAAWSPCIGPTLGGAIALASQGESLARAGAIMGAFSLGVATVLLGLAYGARGLLLRNRARAARFAAAAKPALGLVFVAVAVLILSGYGQRLEGAVLNLLPAWLQDLSVSI